MGFNFEGKKGVELLESSDFQLKVKINDEDYIIIAQTGAGAKRTMRLVQKAMMPQLTRAQAMIERAYKRLSAEEQARVKKLQELMRGEVAEGENPPTPAELAAAEKEINTLIEKGMDSADYEASMVSVYEALNPDQEAELDTVLMKNVQSVKDGALDDPAKFNKHFTRKTLKNLDVLRDIVIEFNDFLDQSGSRE